MTQIPTWLIAALTLVVGFAVAQATHVRALGGAVLVVGVAACVLREARRTAVWRLLVVGLTGAGCFVVAHVLADSLGAWPAVLLCAAVLAVVTALLVDVPRTRPRVV